MQVVFERQTFKLLFHLTGARVETRRLSATGQGESARTGAPTQEVCGGVVDAVDGVGGGFRGRGVALQVEFERQILKPVFHLIVFRLWV